MLFIFILFQKCFNSFSDDCPGLRKCNKLRFDSPSWYPDIKPLLVSYWRTASMKHPLGTSSGRGRTTEIRDDPCNQSRGRFLVCDWWESSKLGVISQMPSDLFFPEKRNLSWILGGKESSSTWMCLGHAERFPDSLRLSNSGKMSES